MLRGQLESDTVRILHVLPTRDPAFGGPVSTTLALAEASARSGQQVSIDPAVDGEGFGRGLAFLPSAGRIRGLSNAVGSHDVVMLHGLWSLSNSVAAELCRRAGTPYLITPHGMLDRWSMRRRAWKKHLYARILQRRDLDRAAGIRFLNDEELTEAREFGLRAPTFVLANGISVSDVLEHRPRTDRESELHELRDRTVGLFLGRLHPKKGLGILLAGLRQARRTCPDLHIVIAGPDEGGHRHQVERWVSEFDLKQSVTLTGMVRGESRSNLLREADFFVLPSFQEGDSSALKEALAAGLPALITTACHFSELSEWGAGLVVQPDAAAIAAGLVQLASDPLARQSMGQRGRTRIIERFMWERIACDFSDVCLDVLAGSLRSSAWRL